jgi:hypothetical protein
MSIPEKLIITPIPSLAAVLLHHEQEKGSDLTEEEVLFIRDNAVCVTLPVAAHRGVEESRGYKDVDLDDTWASWLELKRSFDTKDEQGQP